MNVAHVERALFFERQAVDAFVLGHEVGEVLGVPGRLAGRDEQVGDVHRQFEGDAHLLRAYLGFDGAQGILESAVQLVQQLLLRLVACGGEKRVQADPRLHPPGAERTADDLQGRRRAAAGDLQGHLAVFDAAGKSLGPQADDLGAVGVDEVGQLTQPFRHLATQHGGRAVGEVLAIGALQIPHRVALRGELEQQRDHLGGVVRRLAVEPYVTDSVRVVERPERRKQLRRLATGELRHLLLPFPSSMARRHAHLSPRIRDA